MTATNVQPGHGKEKTTPPQFSYNGGYFFGDNSMCWAHAASNILQWWQDLQPDDLIPKGTPDGLAATAAPYKGANNMTYYYDTRYVQQLAIFQDITKFWYNNAGTVKRAYNWYFNGTTDTLLGPSNAYNTSATNGGYYADLGLTLHNDGVTSDLFTSWGFYENTKTEVYTLMQSYIDNSYGTTLSIGAEGFGHAITMWGYEMNGDDMIVYLTDSDDLKHALFRQKVLVDDSHNIYLTSLDGTDVYTNTYTDITIDGVTYSTFTGARIGEIQGFIGASLIPEPTTATLSLLALCGLAARRRR